MKANIKKWLKRISLTIIGIALLIGLGFLIYWLVEFKIPQSKEESFIEEFIESSNNLSDSEYINRVGSIIESPDTFNTGSEFWNSNTLRDFTNVVKPKLEKLAYKGNADAAFLMGKLTADPSFYLANNGRVYESNNDKKGAFYYRISADAGHTKAQAMLAKFYLYGKGVPKNYVEAYEWACKSANGNCAEGMTILGKLYSTGIYSGIPQYVANKYPELVDDNRVAISDRFPHDGVILRPDITLARKLWKKAIDLGNVDAKEYFEKVYTSEQISKDPNIDYDAY